MPLCCSTNAFKSLLWIIWMAQFAFCSDSSIVDVSGGAKTSASSVLEGAGIRFQPRWAADGVASRLSTNCFVSKKEPGPWWRLDLGESVAVRKVRIYTKTDDLVRQPAVKLDDMRGVSVFVGNDAEPERTGQLCGEAVDLVNVSFFVVNCSASGRFVRVVLPGNGSHHLALCEVVINEDDAAMAVLVPRIGEIDGSVTTGQTVENGSLAIDGDLSDTSCSSATDLETGSWIRVDLQRPYLISAVPLYFTLSGSAENYSVVVELRVGDWPSDEKQDYSLCNVERMNVTNVTSGESKNVSGACDSGAVFGQYVFVTVTTVGKNNATLKICEIQIKHIPFRDIYRGRQVSASSQADSSGIPPKAIDGYVGTAAQSCFASKNETKPWWRVDFGKVESISSVQIISSSTEINEHAVYIGNSSSVSIFDGSMQRCNSNVSVTENGTAMVLMCAKPLSGRYVHITRLEESSVLTLCEVSFFRCPADVPLITFVSSRSLIEYNRTIELKCSAMGCPVPSVSWTGPGGQAIAARTEVNGTTVTSYLYLNDSSDDGTYICSAVNVIGVKTAQTLVQVHVSIPFGPQNVTIEIGDVAHLTCITFGALVTLWFPQSVDKLPITSLPRRLQNSTIAITFGGLFTCSVLGGPRADFKRATVFVRPHVFVSPSSLSVVDGTIASSVECVVEGFPQPSLVWIKNGSVVNESFVSEEMVTEEGHFRVQKNLTLGQVSLSDAGAYSCEGRNTDALRKANFTLVVSLDIKLTKEPQDVYGEVGDRVERVCEASGASAATIQWKKGSLPLNGSREETVNGIRSTLTISTLQLSDGGSDYVCTAGPASQPDAVSSRSATVGVNPFLLVAPSNAVIPYGGILRLNCTIGFYPTGPQLPVKWFKDDILLDVATEDRPDGGTQIVSSLEIRGVNETTGGLYKCFNVSTEAASVSVGAFFVLHPVNASVVEGNTTMLSCVAVGYPKLIVVWERSADGSFASPTIVKDIPGHLNTTSQSDGERKEESRISVFGIQRSEGGYYRCRSGAVSSGSAFIDVYYTPVFVNQPEFPQVQLNESQSFNLSCTISEGNPPSTSVVWTFLPLNSQLEKDVSANHRISLTSAGQTYSLFVINATTSDSGSYRCRAVNEAGSVYSNSTEVLVTGIPSAVSTANISFTSVTDRNFSVMWLKPFDGNSAIFSYIIQYSEKGSGIFQVVTPMPSSLMATVVNLKPYLMYEVTIQAKNTLGVSPSGPVVSIQTQAGVPSPPRDVSIVPVSSTSFRLSWLRPEDPNGPIDYYRVFYESAGSPRRKKAIAEEQRDYPGANTSVILDGLVPFTTYKIRVSAVNVIGSKYLVGESNPMAERSTLEDEPSTPGSLTVKTVPSDSSALDVMWLSPNPANGRIRKYWVYYRRSRTPAEPWTLHEVNGSATKTRLLHLDALTKYEVKVAAATIKNGSFSDSAIGWTAPLPALVTLSVSDVTETTLAVTLPGKSDLASLTTRVQVLVAETTAGQTVDFGDADSQPYVIGSAVGVPYVAIELPFVALKTGESQVILGTGNSSRGYENAALKPETSYAYALRVFQLTAADSTTELFSTSKTFVAQTKKGETIGVGLIIGIVVGVLALIILCLVVASIIMWRRRHNRLKMYLDSSLVIDNEGITGESIVMGELTKPQVNVVHKQVSTASGDITMLNVQVTGNPRPKVTWRFSAQDLPGKDGRIKILPNGSLQIRDTSVMDAGLYKCLATNRLGSDGCQVKVAVEPGIDEMPEMPDPIAVEEFEEHVFEMHANSNHDFSMEYQMLDKSNKHPSLIASLPMNRDKNRYGNIAPYDHSRVVLKLISGEPGSDYINASYVPGYDDPQAYIAAQGPNEKTVDDFWRMVFQERVPTVVMVTKLEEKGKVKCHKYWPDNASNYGEIAVTLQQETLLADCSVRILNLFRELPDGSRTETHQTTQFHFSSWPDHGVPEYPTALLNFQKRVRAYHETVKHHGPLLAHCSAGVGRTGTFLAIDYCLQRIASENVVDIFTLVSEFRQNRPAMVQTEAQYSFCHDAVLEYIICGNTEVSAQNMKSRVRQLEAVDHSSRLSGFENELLTLDKVGPDEKDFSYSTSNTKENVTRNRYSYCLPPDKSRVHLNSHPGRPDGSVYINANYVDGFRRQAMYLTTQGPFTYTIGDFWRMVWDHNCRAIVMLTEVEESGQELSAVYWPREGESKYDGFSVSLESENVGPDFAIRQFYLSNPKGLTRDVAQFHYLNWTENRCPKSAASLLEMTGHLEKSQQQTGNQSIVVMCNNGVGRSATFCAIYTLIERLKAEQVADVFQVVKALRLQNPHFVASLDRYKFCYTAAAEFLDSFDTYKAF